jgi:hypothetical protein
MKSILFAAVSVAVMLCAAPSWAANAASPKPIAPDWHYVWHQNQWWYWMPESRHWMVWNGSQWRPYQSADESKPVVVTTAAMETTEEVAAPAYSGGSYCPPSYSTGGSSGYAGYGWSWGPGTAFRDSPGRRF